MLGQPEVLDAPYTWTKCYICSSKFLQTCGHNVVMVRVSAGVFFFFAVSTSGQSRCVAFSSVQFRSVPFNFIYIAPTQAVLTLLHTWEQLCCQHLGSAITITLRQVLSVPQSVLVATVLVKELISAESCWLCLSLQTSSRLSGFVLDNTYSHPAAGLNVTVQFLYPVTHSAYLPALLSPSQSPTDHLLWISSPGQLILPPPYQSTTCKTVRLINLHSAFSISGALGHGPLISSFFLAVYWDSWLHFLVPMPSSKPWTLSALMSGDVSDPF